MQARAVPVSPWRIASIKFLFGIDLRTLALFRICMGVMLLMNLFFCALYLRPFFSDFGVLPRAALYEIDRSVARFTFHTISGSEYIQAILFGLAALLAVSMIFGFFTRTVTILSWLFLVSMENRNLYIGSGSDVLLRNLLFWAMFLPLGARFSIDSRLRPDRYPRAQTHCGISSAAMLIQPALLYTFTALLKTDPDWWRDGTAVYYALQLDSFASPFGRFLREYPEVLSILTRFVLGLEFAAVFLFFTPFFQPLLRIVGLILFFGMHLGFFINMKLELFPLVSWMMLICLIPGFAWDSKAWRDIAGGTQQALGRWRGVFLGVIDRFGAWAAATLPRSPIRQGNEPRLLRRRRVSTFARESAVYVLLVIVVLGNFKSLPEFSWSFWRPVDIVVDMFRLDQNWAMFAPRPSHSEYYFVIPGVLENGEKVDVYRRTKGEPAWVKPFADRYSHFASRRWRKYLEKLPNEKYKHLRLWYGRYLCRSWNEYALEGERLSTFTIGVLKEITKPNYEPDEFRKQTLWKHDCGLKKSG